MTQRNKILLAIAALLLIAVAIWIAPKILRRLHMQGMKPVTVAKGIEFPWGFAFLPDGRMLVTERPGRMRIVAADGTLGAPLSGLPPVWADGEGGLMDVVLDPGFPENKKIYWAFSEPAEGGKPGASTAVAYGRLRGNAIRDAKVIFRQPEKVTDNRHFGARLLFAPDGNLFVTLGDRSKRDDAQKLSSAHGKIVRIAPEGGAAAGNPFTGQADALPEIWTFGHRNVQGIAINPANGEMWASEHGPQGGDELNVIQRGRNYGWPVISHGCEYTTCAKIGEGAAKSGMESPLLWWGPASTAPSGMTFVSGNRYPEWNGQLFIANLADKSLLRVKIDGRRVLEQQRLVTGLLERIRDVKQGPDGWLYILTGGPDGRIIRVER
jgi:aldose sugar dehydrogenase